MKTTILLTNLMVATLMFIACSKEDNSGDNWDGLLHLSSGVATLTRSTHNLDEKIAQSETVWLYVDGSKTDKDAVQYYGKQITANGNNGFTDAGSMYFPTEETSINLYAFHINEKGTSGLSGDNYPSSQLTHQVAQDQQSSTNGYAKSDLLYAKTSLTKENAKSSGGAVALPFKHLLSKIEVVLKKDVSLGNAAISKVEILNTKLEGTFTPSKTAEFSVTVSGSEGDNPIEIDRDITDSSGSDKLNEAIIIPQTISEGTAFIRVTLSTGSVLTYLLDDGNSGTSSVSFASGAKYRYTITAKLTGLTVTSSISSWSGNSSASGEATIN